MQSKKSNSVIFNQIGRRLWELLEIACIFLFLLSIPFIAIVLILLYVYRCSVKIVLKIQLRDKFAGFLKGADCIWAIENPVSLSIINILVILEKPVQNSNTIFLEDLRNLINDRIVSKAKIGTTFEKICYLRNQKFGYCFWERSEKVDVKDRIRWLECVDANCDGSCENISDKSFRKTLENVFNKPLPDDHKATWEILIGRCYPNSKSHINEDYLSSSEECFNTDIRKIPILFRIHHSLGDGFALLNLFLKTIAEEEITKVKIKSIISSDETGEHFKEIVPTVRNSERNFQNETDVVRSYEKNIFAISISFTYVTILIVQSLLNYIRASLKFLYNVTIKLLKQQTKISIDCMWLSFKNIVRKQIYCKFQEIMQCIMILLSSPKFLVQQAICNKDKNALHGPPQTGEKLVYHWLENDMTNNKSQSLLTKIREIKKNTGSKFEDVVLAALSASVHKYHLRINKPVPDALTVISPIRLSMPDKNLTLDNNFTVGLLKLCIANVNGQTIVEPNRDSQFFKRLQDITKANDKLRKSSDILLNFWIMKYITVLMPVKMLRGVLSNLSHSTVGFSNMHGPGKVRILNNSLNNMVFWLPNNGTIALCFSILSYEDKLNLSLIADKSIIKDERFLMELSKNIIYEIDSAYNSIKCTF